MSELKLPNTEIFLYLVQHPAYSQRPAALHKFGEHLHVLAPREGCADFREKVRDTHPQMLTLEEAFAHVKKIDTRAKEIIELLYVHEGKADAAIETYTFFEDPANKPQKMAGMSSRSYRENMNQFFRRRGE